MLTERMVLEHDNVKTTAQDDTLSSTTEAAAADQPQDAAEVVNVTALE